MADPIALDVAYTARQIEAMLTAYPELADDDELRVDMLDGETELTGLLSRLVKMRQERTALADGLSGYIGALTERKARILRGAEGIKHLMLALMTSAQLPKLVLPEATVSVGKPRESVSILDIDALPQGFFATERKPLKDAIKAAIDRGEDVPGAGIVVGEPSLTVRVK